MFQDFLGPSPLVKIYRILRTLKFISIVVQCRNYYIHLRQQKQKLGMMQLV